MLHAARQMKQSVLISNFVDRESERPVIGPSDLISFMNSSDPGSLDNMKADQRQCSDKKTKKPKTKTRKSDQGNSAEVPGSGSNAAENCQTKKTRKRKSRNDLPNKYRDNIMRIPDENTITTFNAEWRFKKGKTFSRRQKTQVQPDISKAKSSQTLQIMAACNRVDHFSLVPSQNGNNDKIAGVSRQYVESSMEEDIRICADEEEPLISWLKSLACRRKKKKVEPEQPAQALATCSHSTRSKRPIKTPARLLD